MIFDINSCVRVCRAEDCVIEGGEWTLPKGLWVVLMSSGKCIALSDEQKAIQPGSILVSNGGAEVHVVDPCHFIGLEFSGMAADALGAQLEEMKVLDGSSCAGAAELIWALCNGLPGWQSNATAFRLLCQLSEADYARSEMPPMVTAAIVSIRENYAHLYGLDELSEQLGVTKEHLVRTFKKSVGVPPGQYLNAVKIEHAKTFLLHRDYTLDVIATLCGYSGANYFCKAFRKEVGCSPAQWRNENLPLSEKNKTVITKEELAIYL